jgi:hypothetical protein
LKTCDDKDEDPLDDLMELGKNWIHMPYHCGEFRDESFIEDNIYVGLAFEDPLSVAELLEAVETVKKSNEVRDILSTTQQTWDNEEDITIWACPSYL